MLLHYRPSDELREGARKIATWFGSLDAEERASIRKNESVGFSYALAQARFYERGLQQWEHAVSEAKARKTPPDPVGAPEVLKINGCSIVWLKTQDARDAEAAVMKERVGDTAGHGPAPGGETFSLRVGGRSYSTFIVSRDGLEDSIVRGPENYSEELVQAADILRARLIVAADPAVAIEDGEHRLEDGTVARIRDGLLHDWSGPALELPDGTREWCHGGKRDRRDGPAVERPNREDQWYRDGIRYKGARLTIAIEHGLFAVPGEPQMRP